MKKLRWLFFIPAGVFEVVLLIIAGILLIIHFLGSELTKLAHILPSIGWYLGDDYEYKPLKRKK